MECEEDRVKKTKIIEDLKSEVDSLSIKVEKLEKLPNQQEQYSRKNSLLVHGIAEEKEETTDKVIFNTLNDEEITDKVIFNALNDKLDLEITLRDIDRTHRIEEPKNLEKKPVLLL